MPNSSCCFTQERVNATAKWKWSMLRAFMLISGVIALSAFTRNHLQKTADCWPPFCWRSPTAAPTAGLKGNELPLCSGNLLDKREHHYAKETDGSYDNSRLVSKSGSCRLMRYSFEQVVGCLDALFERRYPARNFSDNLDHIDEPNKNLHFVFIGDSRMRQQFFNFLKLIPDYDRKSKPSPLPFRYQSDMEVTSNILRLRLSFQWRALVNDTVIDTIRQWATDQHRTDRPNLIFLGIAVWHMLPSKGADFKLYRKQMERLAPFLSRLAKAGRVIWLNQYPAVEKFGNTGAMNTNIFSDKIHRYNEAARSELQRYPEVRIVWDSSNSLVEEYIRGCVISQQRVQFGMHRIINSDFSYINCKDPTHSGYAALSQATQLLLNDLCNSQNHIP